MIVTAPISLQMTKETKNCFKFEASDARQPIVGALYINKAAFPEGCVPGFVSLSIAVERD